MKPTLKEFKEAQKLFMENKEKWEQEGKIEGKGGRSDGYVTEDLVRRTLGWKQNNDVNPLAADAYEEVLGYGDIKTGSAKRYGGTFWLEVIQNPRTKSIADWANSTTDFVAYLDWSDDTFPLYIFSTKKLIRKFMIYDILNSLTDQHYKYYDTYWSKNSKLPLPRVVELDKSFSCFGKRALGFELSIEDAVGKLILTDYMEEEDDRTTISTARASGTDKKETSGSIRRTKK